MTAQLTPQQMIWLMNMQQSGNVAPTQNVKSSKIAAGPAPLQQLPQRKEVQIEQKQQTEAEKLKKAIQMTALNAGMSNAFKASTATAAMTNPMAAPLALASSMFLKEGDKVPDYEQQTFRGQPIDWSNPWEYVGMDKQTAMDPSSEFSTKFARKMGGQDFSTEGPGVGSQRYIPELDMNNWQKYGYDYGRIKEMFLDNPDNRTSEPYQAFLWSHMSTPQRLKAMQEGGVFSNWGVRDYLETGDDNAWRKYVPQDVKFEPDEEVPFSDDDRWNPDLYYSKGNKVKKPGYYNEGEEVQGGTPWWRLGPLARLFGRGRRLPPDMVEAKPPLTPDDPGFNKGMTDKNIRGMTDKNIKGMTDEIRGPSRTAWEKHLDKMMRDLPKKKYDRFMENFRKLSITDQNAWLENREREFRYNEYQKELEKDLKNARMSKSKAPDSLWNQVKKGFKNIDDAALKFVKAPLGLPLTAAGIALGGSPLNVDEVNWDPNKAKLLEQDPIISEEEQEYLMRKAVIEENNPQPVYKGGGGGAALDNAIDYFNNYNWRTQGQPSMMPDQPYFQNISSSSDDNSSFTDQVMDGNVNVWGPLSLGFGGNNPFGGQVGFGTSVPLMGGKPQW